MTKRPDAMLSTLRCGRGSNSVPRPLTIACLRGRLAAAIACAMLLAPLAGCGSSGIYPVEGLVVWKDGSPAKELANTLIFFEQPDKQLSAQGQIQADGTFRLTTLKENDGAPEGENTVRLIEVGRKALGGPDASLLAPGKIDSRYASNSTTDLKATITRGVNKITLTVEPPR